MATVFDVAHYILEKKGSMTTWKLQKLCYYAQAWSLAWTGKPLFNEDFQAWTNGPVCPELYYQHRGKFTIGVAELQQGNSSALTDDQKDTINIVLNGYGDMAPYDLREQTHQESPWVSARGNLAPDATCDTIITKNSMGDYYGSL